MKKFSKKKAKGKVGVIYVSDVVFQEGSIFREVPEDTDIGIDGYIDFVVNEDVTGMMVGIQIKTGYVKKRKNEDVFSITFSRADLSYFYNHVLPVALIAYDPDTKASAWLDLTEYIRLNQSLLNKKSITISLSILDTPFTVKSFADVFKPTFQRYQDELVQLKLKSNQIFELDNQVLLKLTSKVASVILEEKFQGFVGLLNSKILRSSPYTCFLLLTHIFHENEVIRSLATDSLARYLPHPEFGFIPPPKIREYIQVALSTFGREEVKELLLTGWLDEDTKFQRGSVGQSVGVIIINIPNFEYHLYELAIDSTESYEIRSSILMILVEFGFFHILEPIIDNFDQIRWGEASDVARMAFEAYVETESSDETEFLHSDNNLKSIVEEASCNSDLVGEILLDAGLFYLVNNRHAVEEIWLATNNPYVRTASSWAMNRILKYHNSLTGSSIAA